MTSGGTALAPRIARAFDAIPSVDEADLSPLKDRIGDARAVLIGEASHGTAEFYRFRARLTRELIEAGRIRFVGLEADWPDAARLDRYVRHVEGPERRGDALSFGRFPRWMWRNEEVLEFVDWLRDWNRARPADERVGIHGLDLYSLGESIEVVIAYLEDVDPQAAHIARGRYACLDPFATDPALYGYATLTQSYRSCEDDVVAMLQDLLARRLEYAERDGERFLDAAANARLAADAERYYRVMYQSDAASWNLRDQHMFDMFVRMLDAYGPGAAGAIWAHNSHLGDASATAMASRGELNVGQLVRERFGAEAYLVGFGTHGGTVMAAHQWGGAGRVMDLNASRSGSYERLMHETGVGAGMLGLREDAPGGRDDEVREALMEPRLERAVGVVYRPETELMSHYFQAVLPRQFDEYVWFDETRALDPIDRRDRAPLAADHPFATLDV